LANTFRPEGHTLRTLPLTRRSTFDFKAGTRLLFVALAFSLACFFAGLHTQARTSPSKSSVPACEENRNAPEIVSARWMPNSTLRVMFARGDFSAKEVSAFQEAIRLWQSALPLSVTGIDLQMGGEIAPAFACASCIVVKRKDDLEGTFASLSMASNGGFYNKATINIKGSVHKTTMLRMLLTHELGHAFGLDDCVECGTDTTVMNSVNKYAFGALAFLAPRSKMAAAPTRCDVARVSDGYAGAAAQAQARPTAPTTTTRSVQFIKAAGVANQPPSIGYSGPVINARPAAVTASPGHHASRNRVGQPQRSIKVEQFVLMDALGRRD
jgi:hypothetical protein